MIRLGAHVNLWSPSWTLEKAEKIVEDAVQYGIGVLEISPFDLEDRATMAMTTSLFKEHGIQAVCSFGLPPDIGAPPRATPEAMAFLHTAISNAEKVGAELVTGLPYATLGYTTGVPPTEQEYESIVHLIKPAARRAAEVGLSLGLEACNRYETHLLNTGKQAAMLKAMIDEPNVIVHLDTYHMNIEEQNYVSGFKDADGHCTYVHLSESHRGKPGTGTVDWDDVFTGLAAIGFDGILTLESFMHVPDIYKAVLGVWRDVAPSTGDVLESLPFLRETADRHGVVISASG